LPERTSRSPTAITPFTAVATDSLGRGDTNAITVNLPATLAFLYDQNGNLRTNGSVVMAYDDENQLIAMTNAGAWASTFAYDGKMRMRISKDYEWRNGAWVQTNELRRVYDGMLVIQERNEFNVPKLSYTRGKDLSGSFEGAGGIGGLLALSDHKSPILDHFYFHSDGNGNVTCLVDTNQNVVARYLYDPFGNTLSATGPKAALNKYRFSSKEWHGPSGLVYYGYRWYVPELQRWLNRDPIEEQGGINLFEYAGNDPVSVFDAWGMDPPARKRDPEDHLPPEKPIKPEPPKSPKDYDPKEPGQQFEELEKAKQNCPAAIGEGKKTQQNDQKELEQAAEDELKRRALERLRKAAEEEEARRNRFRVRLNLPNRIDFRNIR
jgi:RHS repeat-associated protein